MNEDDELLVIEISKILVANLLESKAILNDDFIVVGCHKRDESAEVRIILAEIVTIRKASSAAYRQSMIDVEKLELKLNEARK